MTEVHPETTAAEREAQAEKAAVIAERNREWWADINDQTDDWNATQRTETHRERYRYEHEWAHDDRPDAEDCALLERGM